METSVAELASYRRLMERLHARWPAFLRKRTLRLAQARRLGEASEKVAENIIEDLFTDVLDWNLSDLNNQVRYADMVLTCQGVKYLLVETKRPGSLAWHQGAIERALLQARGYAAEQKVHTVAISDGVMFYAADVVEGGPRDRVYVSLDRQEPPEDLWWLSVHGIYRQRFDGAVGPHLVPAQQVHEADEPDTGLLHPKYRLPATAFAYADNPNRTSTWKLPYRLADGSVDVRRLPKAIQSILSNYRGAKVSGIPEEAVPQILLRLARAAASLGHMPPVATHPAPVYLQLQMALEQIDVPPDAYLGQS